MRKKAIVKSLGIIAIILFAFGGCRQKSMKGDHRGDAYALEIDSSLSVLLKPTNQEVVSTINTLFAESGAQLFSDEVPGRINYDTRNQSSLASRISGRIERLYVKYNYQAIRKGELVMEIYSPDLAAAQREILIIAANDGQGNLLQKAKQRLSLLGMSAADIDRLIRTKEVSYRIPIYSNSTGFLIEKLTPSAQRLAMDDPDASMSNSPILLREGQYINAGQTLFTVYKAGSLLAEFSVPPSLSTYVKNGTSLLIQSENIGKAFRGKVDLIEPILKNGERFSLARVHISNTAFRPGQLLKAHIPILIKEGWWIPRKAVWQSGIESIVFKKENGVFIPKTVKTGAILNEKVQLLDDISNWEIASNAYYLVDNESFIRPQNIEE